MHEGVAQTYSAQADWSNIDATNYLNWIDLTYSHWDFSLISEFQRLLNVEGMERQIKSIQPCQPDSLNTHPPHRRILTLEGTYHQNIKSREEAEAQPRPQASVYCPATVGIAAIHLSRGHGC
jgi:hypothetical protein